MILLWFSHSIMTAPVLLQSCYVILTIASCASCFALFDQQQSSPSCFLLFPSKYRKSLIVIVTTYVAFSIHLLAVLFHRSVPHVLHIFKWLWIGLCLSWLFFHAYLSTKEWKEIKDDARLLFAGYMIFWGVIDSFVLFTLPELGYGNLLLMKHPGWAAAPNLDLIALRILCPLFPFQPGIWMSTLFASIVTATLFLYYARAGQVGFYFLSAVFWLTVPYMALSIPPPIKHRMALI